MSLDKGLRDEIDTLTLNSPIVRAAMTYHLRGDVDLETALAMATIALAKANGTLQGRCVELLMNQPGPPLRFSAHNQ